MKCRTAGFSPSQDSRTRSTAAVVVQMTSAKCPLIQVAMMLAGAGRSASTSTMS